MPKHPQAAITAGKLELLCRHFEELCRSAVCLMSTDESAALAEVEARKAQALADIHRMVGTGEIRAFPSLKKEVITRVQRALAAQLHIANTVLEDLRSRLQTCRSAEARLAQVRESYGTSAGEAHSGPGKFIDASG